jgi:putative phosphoribosyl transferase
VAAGVAEALGASLDVLVVRKLGVPGQEELAFGAIATGDTLVLNENVIHLLGLTPTTIDRVVAAERETLAERERLLRGDLPAPVVRGRCVILVDDGLATGATMRAAVSAVRAQAPSRLVVAVPVAPAESVAALAEVADEVVCPLMPRDFYAVGQWYLAFLPVEDEEVREILDRTRQVRG